MNRDEILSLSPAQLRVKVAKAKGWTHIHAIGSVSLIGHNPQNEIDAVPDWANDIAAAFELEGEITELQDQHEYANILYVVIRSTISEVDQKSIENRFAFIHATAEQRCRAWLMWKEAKR